MRRSISIIALLLLTACHIYTAAKVPVPPVTSWQNAPSDSKTNIDQEWWKSFHDDRLNGLIEKARSSSPDIAIAQARVAQARAVEAGTISDQLPALSAGANANRSRASTNIISHPANLPAYSNSYNAAFDASWEIRPFGIMPAVRASKASLELSEANYHAVLVTLSGDVARTYFTLRMTQAEIIVTEKNIAAQKDAVALTEALASSGRVSQIDVALAKSLLATMMASLPPMQDTLKETMYRLDVLVGVPPGTLDKQLETTVDLRIPDLAGLLATPANVLAGRPDVMAAEKNLVYTAALRDVAFTQYFPTLSLAALFGAESSSSNVFLNPASRMWSATGGLTSPIFDFGRIHAQVKQADAAGQEALAQYQKAVLAALSDVESALVAYQHEQQHNNALESSVKANALALSFAETRYNNGLVPYMDVLTAQKALYEAELASAQSRLQLCVDLVRLYKALD